MYFTKVYVFVSPGSDYMSLLFWHKKKTLSTEYTISDKIKSLLVDLGFSVEVVIHSVGLDILGKPIQPDRSSFFMRVLSQYDEVTQDQELVYQGVLHTIKQREVIEKDFLLKGICYQTAPSSGKIDPLDEDELIINKPVFIKALVDVTDPLRQFSYLGYIALKMNTYQAGITDLQEWFKSINKELPQSFFHCPFFIWNETKDTFSFLSGFAEYFWIQEFNRFEQSLYKGSVHVSYNQIANSIDLSMAPPHVPLLKQLLDIRIKDAKTLFIKLRQYEGAAMLRDAERQLYNQFLIAPWPDYSSVAGFEIIQVLNAIDKKAKSTLSKEMCVRIILEQIKSFELAGNNWIVLDELLYQLWKTETPEQGLPVIFSLIERFPEEDRRRGFRSIVSGVGRLQGYTTMLLESLQRQPSILGIAILNRMLQRSQKYIGDISVVEFLHSLLHHPKMTPTIRIHIEGILKNNQQA
ncbi:hypothetical protein QNI16_20585 [Cytophagaceae bacterium YF14B1]|uniref:Uncharacterized protein n=1 Tax=Xanthocytophaga flava TaxID=3048013 RepID=A0AAE3U7Y7_9BACT|nr:hypothetical protein [Xanthocytophaga flavus]MDJ1482911.1 hypothetical protein [Xanthocytophaga flavus]